MFPVFPVLPVLFWLLVIVYRPVVLVGNTEQKTAIAAIGKSSDNAPASWTAGPSAALQNLVKVTPPQTGLTWPDQLGLEKNLIIPQVIHFK